ncbi:hypothetical protein BGZ76_009284 [Entomortierella beljakovae]|nr:hypothetical protein BGZ76_009284 [Entomortierella beljakovae]
MSILASNATNFNRISSPSLSEKDTSVDGSSKKPAPAKRLRIPIACVNCRFKKIKCDGQTPCSHCEKYKTECVYPAASKPVNHQYVEALETRLRSVESYLYDLLSAGPGDSGAGINSSRITKKSTSEDLVVNTEQSTEISSAAMSVTSPLIEPPPPPPTTTDTLIQQQFSAIHTSPNTTVNMSQLRKDGTFDIDEVYMDDGILGTIRQLMGELRVEQDGTPKFLPTFKGTSEHSYINARNFGTGPSPHQLSTISEITHLDWESVDLPRPYAFPSNLLPAKAIQALIDIYFDSVHTFLPILHKASFMSLCHGGKFRVPPFLLMAICATASRHASEAGHQNLKLGNATNHHILFDHARSLVDTFIDIPRISTVQGLLLLSYYQIKEERPGHYYRTRLYLSMAIRMAQDMELPQEFSINSNQVDKNCTGDSMSSNTNTSHSAASTKSRQSCHTEAGAISGHQKDAGNPKKINAVIQYERRLAWLVSYFLDGLSNNILGMEHNVTCAHIEIRKLIREATTAQGATLLFWYHHLDLVQLHRRVIEMYRLSEKKHQNENLAMTMILKGTEFLSIKHALESWIKALPIHLTYTRQSGTRSVNKENLPSYYSLYLHRFYYSIQLLLYRPMIASKCHRGDLANSNSAISKCAVAAGLLTEIGEMIFTNYSWPWLGTGQFVYQMLLAAETHVYLMIVHASSEAKDMYLRTINLIHGYSSLSKQDGLSNNISTMAQAVESYITAPSPAPTTTDHTPNSILRQIQQAHYQKWDAPVATIPLHSNDPYVGSMPVAHIEPQHLKVGQLHQNMQSNSIGMTHGFNKLMQPATSSTLVQHAAGSNTSSSGNASQTPLVNSYHMGIYDANSSPEGKMQESPMSLYLCDMDPMNEQYQHHQHHQQQHPQHQKIIYHQHQQRNHIGGASSYNMMSPSTAKSTSVGNLIDLTIPDSQPITTSLGSTINHPYSTLIDNSRAHSISSSTGVSVTSRFKPSVPPPKPPKRVLPQSTGSTNSSNRSISQRPPVPKKPSRLVDTRIVGTLTSMLNSEQQQQWTQQSGNPTQSSGSLPILQSKKDRRIARPLLEQPQLYGMGALKSSLNRPGLTRVDHDDEHRDHSLQVDDLCLDLNYSALDDYPFELNSQYEEEQPTHIRFLL